MIMMCQPKFIDGDECTTLAGAVYDGGGDACGGARERWESSAPSSCFCSKTALKSKVLKKKKNKSEITPFTATQKVKLIFLKTVPWIK